MGNPRWRFGLVFRGEPIPTVNLVIGTLGRSPPTLLAPTRQDLTYLKRFLDETARECNKRVGDRLAELLTLIHNESPGLLVPADLANRISTAFQIVLQVAGSVGVVV
jgi:hypothetical protein